MAGIYKRGNKWGAIFYVNGEKKRTSTGIEVIPSEGRTAIQNKKLAQQVADTMEMHAKKQASGATLAASLRALANTSDDTPSLTAREYLENYTPSGRDQNQLNPQRAIKLFFKYLRAHKLDSFALSDIKRKHCEEFLGERIQEVAEGTVRTYRSHLSAAFNRAVAEELINRNLSGYPPASPGWGIPFSSIFSTFWHKETEITLRRPQFSKVCINVCKVRF